jgi:translation initiation factor IF-1
MVKNTTGGNKHKGLARKLVNAPTDNKLRLSEDECECYAKTVKMLGNGMCHVNLVFKNQLFENVVCHIRGKFKNRNKHSNLVSIGDYLLVGIRSWESNIHNCDLIIIYSSNQSSLLPLPSSLISNSNPSNHDHDNDNDHIHFHSGNSFHYNDISTSNDNHIDLDLLIDNDLI